MKHNDDGNFAEEQVADYLVKGGYEIVDRNWKTKFCEIDIVAKKDSCAYLVEVKYRSNAAQGSGFEYITRSKLQQMKRAADAWATYNNWPGEYVLSAAEVSGPNFEVEFLEQII